MRTSWAAIPVAILMAIVGIVLTIGGAWLAVLGGSIYYLIAGVALLASAWFLFRGRLLGGWIYIGLFILSAIWGFAESRGNAWAMVPWLIAPLVILVLVLLVMPTLTQDRNRWKLAGGGIALGVLFVAASFAVLGLDMGTEAAALPAQASPGMTDPSVQTTGADWPDYGGTNAAWRYSPLTQITPANVGKLEKVWEVHTGGLPTNPDYLKLYGTENTPLKIGNLLYTCTAKNVIVALDAAAGKPVWRVDPHVPDKWIPYTTACRGLAYYKVPGAAANTPCASRIIEGTLDSRLLAVDALTGKPCTDFNGTGQQDTKIGMGPVYPGYATINSAPTIVRGIIVVPHQILDGQCRCSPSGVIQGFDAKTGKLAWAWDVEHPDWNGYPPAGQTWHKATPNSWMSSSGDEKLGLVYLPMGNYAADYISTGRPPRSDQVNSSIVAIDVTTGKPRWVFQTVKKDVWDYDIGSTPSLIDYHGTPALLVASKQGDLYVLDRATGKSLAPIGSVAAPPGGVEPSERAPRQIVSLWHSLKMPDLVESDMWGMSPIDLLIWRIHFRQADYRGEVTPPRADKYTIEYPGYNGGSDWGSLSIDPVRGVAIANYNDMPNYLKLVPRAIAKK
jgi:quinoprotein glucose dehydrogenase